MTIKNKVITFFIGIYFGIVLIKSQVISWFQINDMFHFKDPYMYLVICSAIAVGMVSVFLIRKFEARTIEGDAIVIKERALHPGNVIGGTIFGMGWAITGACPGPVYAHIGAGNFAMLATFLGGIVGMYLYAFFQSRLPHTEWVRLKPSSTSAS
ncbi:MAG: YeeE/YedE family protein [Anaerolineales bacterium]|nr:YeeE/YedE family protein [Anaerolineales bacterium]